MLQPVIERQKGKTEGKAKSMCRTKACGRSRAPRQRLDWAKVVKFEILERKREERRISLARPETYVAQGRCDLRYKKGDPYQTEGQQPRGRKSGRKKGRPRTPEKQRAGANRDNEDAKEGKGEGKPNDAKRKRTRPKEQLGRNREKKTGREKGEEGQTATQESGPGKNQRRKAKEQEEEREKNGAELPPGTTDLITGQTAGVVESFGGPPKDCTRVFPMKGAADALRNPKADVPGCVAGQATHGARLRGNPRDKLTQGQGPPSSASLQDERTEGGTQGGHLKGSVLEEVRMSCAIQSWTQFTCALRENTSKVVCSVVNLKTLSF